MGFAERAKGKSARVMSFVALAATLSLGACAKQESIAELNAEIDRRVDQRIEAEHQAEEKQKLEQRQANLEAREKALAAQESSFATMTASLPAETTSMPAESAVATGADTYSGEGSSSTPDYYSNYPNSSGQFYGDQDGDDLGYNPYLGENPYFYAQGVPYVTVINQNARIFYQRRNSGMANRGQRRDGMLLAPARQPLNSRPNITGRRPTMGTPIQTINRRPVRSVMTTQQGITHRPTGRVTPQGNR